MNAGFTALACGMIVLVLAQTADARPQCPDGGTALNGFVVERGDRSKTEVFHVDDSQVRTIFRAGGRTVLETTQFQGLFDLERIDKGKRTVFAPESDLASAYPPNVGQKITTTFEVTEGPSNSKLTVLLDVKKLDRLFIGPCAYRVLLLDRSEQRGEAPMRFRWTDYFSPDLKLIIAKEFRDGGGCTTLTKFDRIYPLKP